MPTPLELSRTKVCCGRLESAKLKLPSCGIATVPCICKPVGAAAVPLICTVESVKLTPATLTGATPVVSAAATVTPCPPGNRLEAFQGACVVPLRS